MAQPNPEFPYLRGRSASFGSGAFAQLSGTGDVIDRVAPAREGDRAASIPSLPTFALVHPT
jgi:hypothetical protein